MLNIGILLSSMVSMPFALASFRAEYEKPCPIMMPALKPSLSIFSLSFLM